MPLPLRRFLLASVVALALTTAAAGCGSSPSSGSGGRPTVVATTTQLGDLVRAVGGPDVVVHQILQPNTDPHEYEPRPDDVRAVASARLVVESGDRLDLWMGKVVSQAGGSPRVFTVAPAHTPFRRAGETSGPEASRYDPHWWHDPRNTEAAVRAIAGQLSAVDPRHRQAYTRRKQAYLAKLRRLDAGIARCFAPTPRSERKLVTDHDAFGYFADRYGIAVVGAIIPSQTTQAQPSAKSIAVLTALIRREHVRAVFPESSINPKLAEAIARSTGARSNLTLYGDTLGPAGSSGATYLSMERANANAMEKGFTGGASGCSIGGLR